MAYILWENASWSTLSADALYEDGNHVVLEVVSAAVPSLLNLRLHSRVVEVVVEVDSEAALTVAVADSVEVEVVAVSVEEDVEEDLVTAGDSVTEVALVTVVEVGFEAVAVASEVTGTTLDHREVEGASGRYLLCLLDLTC
jgi:hypothetical protein